MVLKNKDEKCIICPWHEYKHEKQGDWLKKL